MPGRLTGFLSLAALLLAARLPLHRVTAGLPVSNDDAIPLLMAGQLLQGEFSTILWNQPYNGTLDAYLLAPGLAVASPHTVFRIYEAVCGILLVVAAGLLARSACGEPAGWAAAGLAAVGTPYMALMAATGPTPNFLVPLLVSGAALWGLGRLPSGAAGDEGAGSPGGSVVLLGVMCGLAVWNSMLALPALAGVGVGLLVAGLRVPLRAVLLAALGLALGFVPLLIAKGVGASGASAVTALRPRWLWLAGVQDLTRAGAGLVGLQVPLVVDGPERAELPVALAVLLGVGLIGLLAAGISRRTLPFVTWAAALALAFAASRRTGGDEIRYLFGIIPPLLALAGCGIARLAGRSRGLAALASLALVVPWAVGHRAVTLAWSDPTHASRVWQVPSIDPALGRLQQAGVQSAYASLQLAGRLALAGEGSLRVSQAWNERIPGDPMRFRDEVDLDPAAAWVLSPVLSRGMPRATGFRDLLRSMGGEWQEDEAGELRVFRAFRPPFNESKPLPASSYSLTTLDGAALPQTVHDRDPRTAWTSAMGLHRGSGLLLTLGAPRRVSAMVLVVALDPTPLGVPWIAEQDGAMVAQGPHRHVLQWVNAVPRAGRQAILTVVLPATVPARTLALRFQDAGPPLTVSEAFVYGPDEPALPRVGDAAAARALLAARHGDWPSAVAGYREALLAEPHRASWHANLARAEWRARGRRFLDVEGLGDGGPDLVEKR